MTRAGILAAAIIMLGAISTTAAAAPDPYWASDPRGRHTTASYYEGTTGAFGPLRGHYAASKWWAPETRLLVCTKRGGEQCVRVTILDRCQCGLDLRRSVFAALFGGTSRGTGRVWMEKAR